MVPSPLDEASNRTIYLNAPTLTDLELVEAVMEALEELKERYGIYVDLKIVPTDALTGFSMLPVDEVTIEIFGSQIELTGLYDLEDDELKENVKRRIVEEVIRRIGSANVEQAREVYPWSIGEKPKYSDAVLVAQ